MTTWRYALTKESVDWYAIREIYIDDNGGLSWTKDAIDVTGNTPAEIAETLKLMAECVQKPILDLTATPVAFVEDLSEDHPRWLDDEPPGED